MPYSDPEKQKEYQREWQRSRKAGIPMKPITKSLNQADIKTAQDMLNVLTDVLAQLMSADADLFMKARTIAYVVSVGLKATEVAELERRLGLLEEKMLSGSNTKEASIPN